jgi:hypothetical protein
MNPSPTDPMTAPDPYAPATHTVPAGTGGTAFVAAEPPDPKRALVGRQLGNYLITGVLGEGGMGVVYAAENVLLRRRAAIKTVRADREGAERAAAKFVQEAQAAARLSHPNVVAVYDVGRQDDLAYIAMELVPGGTAEDYLQARGAFSWKEAARIVIDACKGLSAAHAAGMVHRDIKPANIMRDDAGRSKLADFGLARFVDDAAAGGPGGKARSDTAGAIMGTPHYLSPEQARGRPVDGRSDLYSLGATFYALLTGQPPFDPPGGTMDVVLAHLNREPPDPCELNPRIPPGAAEVVFRAMAKNPDERFQSADEMRMALENLLAEADSDASGAGWADFRAEMISAGGVGLGRGVGGSSGSIARTLSRSGSRGGSGDRIRSDAGPSAARLAVMIGAPVLAGLVLLAAYLLKSPGSGVAPGKGDGDPAATSGEGPGRTDPPESGPADPQEPDAIADSPPIGPEEAVKRVGRVCHVEMTVARVGGNKTLFLNSERDFTRPANLTIAISKGVKQLDEAGVNDAAAHFQGKRIRVVGRIEKADKGGAQISVGKIGQVKIVK